MPKPPSLFPGLDKFQISNNFLFGKHSLIEVVCILVYSISNPYPLQNKKLMITMLMAYKMAPLAHLNLPGQYCFYYRVNGDIDSLAHNVSFWGQKLHHFVSFWVQKYCWTIFTISGPRNSNFLSVSGSRNCTISSVSGPRDLAEPFSLFLGREIVTFFQFLGLEIAPFCQFLVDEK